MCCRQQGKLLWVQIYLCEERIQFQDSLCVRPWWLSGILSTSQSSGSFSPCLIRITGLRQWYQLSFTRQRKPCGALWVRCGSEPSPQRLLCIKFFNQPLEHVLSAKTTRLPYLIPAAFLWGPHAGIFLITRFRPRIEFCAHRESCFLLSSIYPIPLVLTD